MDVVREALVFKVVVLSCGCIGFGWEDGDILPDPFLEPNPSKDYLVQKRRTAALGMQKGQILRHNYFQSSFLKISYEFVLYCILINAYTAVCQYILYARCQICEF